MAQRRILDSAAQSGGLTTLQEIAAGYRPGDTDLAWGRISGWRTQLAATLDYLDIDRVTAVEVSGVEQNPSVALLAGWLALCLSAQIGGVYQVLLTTEAGAVQLTRLNDQTVQLEVPGQPTFSLFMPRRSLASLLAEELRRLSPDSVYGDVLLQGLTLISPTSP
jgi:glucose-6-phosphate dehydrogenase assembly protein OpcA